MFTKSREEVLKELSVKKERGLSDGEVAARREKYGANVLRRSKQKTLIMRVLEAFSEPMLIILCFALAITLGVNIGKFIKTGDGDFIECIGIFIAVAISVTITVVMEGRSERAFELLNEIKDKSLVKVRRSGEVRLIPQGDAVVGDVVILEAGSKVVADGRLISSNRLCVDESMLTGESKPRDKRADITVAKSAPLSERINCVYGGTCVTSGSGEMVVTAVGEGAEIGKIANELQSGSRVSAPLSQKLARLGKLVTAVGGITAAAVFVISLIRLIATGRADFFSVQEIFIESVVLIVAAVPEGLPTIVAISLSLNVVKLARDNALIKKLVVAETAGCVSVICSDKTGTLTKNDMTVEALCSGELCGSNRMPRFIYENIAVNTTAQPLSGGKGGYEGSPTECALLRYAFGKNASALVRERESFDVLDREEFSSDKKYMSTKTHKNGTFCTYYKGAFEKIAALCRLSEGRLNAVKVRIDGFSRNARRVIAFAHTEGDIVVFDGFAAIADPVRDDVKKAVSTCRQAGIAVKILTGDNAETAYAVAREIGVASARSQVLNAPDIEGMSDQKLARLLPSVSVIARSTPLIKLRIVKLLMQSGEVVAVTGDGINDAPAIKQADIGIAMGSGSEIAKEAGDIVLLDDSFSTIVKAIAFGRNVFNNFLRFIMFQLSVNFSAVLTVLAALICGLPAPFNALQLLWINVIMDGPPALTLGFEPADKRLMSEPPKKRSTGLISAKTAGRIILHSVYMAGVLTMQMVFNFLRVPDGERATVIFTTFVLFQLINAFNCRRIGTQSIFDGFFKNKAMLVAFGLVTVLQIVITQFGGRVFGTVPLCPLTWLKIAGTALSIVIISEASKLVYRLYRRVKGQGDLKKVKTV